MKFISVLVFAAVSFGFLFNASANETQVKGVSLICEDENKNILAFNMKDKRIWFSMGSFDKNGRAFELKNVEIATFNGTSPYSAKVHSAGPRNVSGVIFWNKVPVQATYKHTEKPGKPNRFFCRLP
jgi:hypothetical protein